MFKVKNKVYSDAGYILVQNGVKIYQKEGVLSDFTEEPLSLENLRVLKGGIVDLGATKHLWNPNWTYAQLKTDLVHKRYSNDDQIAIILNKDNSEEDALAFQKMQEWRDWCSQVAKAIIEKRN